MHERNLIIVNGGRIFKAKSYLGNLKFFLKATSFKRRKVTAWNLYLGKLSPAKLYKTYKNV